MLIPKASTLLFLGLVSLQNVQPPATEPASPEDLFRRALALAGKGDPQVVLAALERAITAGVAVDVVLTEPTLLALHEMPSFRALIRRHAMQARATLVTPEESGEPMAVSGTIRDDEGRPIAGAHVYVFHADANGHYTPTRVMDEPHARLFAYLRTGDDGTYGFRTIRPGWYPGAPDRQGVAWEIPAHIHFEVEAEGYATRRFQMVFDDDPRMKPQRWRDWAAKGRHPVVAVERDADGLQRCVCDISLDR